MSEAERRTKYTGERVLIEAERILAPQFAAQGIFLSGAQVELLRNVVEYLGRDTTFVDEYHGGYYLSVTDDDWDTIQSIVADLEDKLLMNDNTMWGYSETWESVETEVSDASSPFIVETDAVGAGELVSVETFVVWHNHVAERTVLATLVRSAVVHPFTGNLTVPSGVWLGGGVALTLAEGDKLSFEFYNTALSDICKIVATGSKMIVPE